MKILMTGGGTAGHINPALAIADALAREYPGSTIKFVGREGGMESRLVPQAGYEFIPMEVQGFHRSFTPAAILHNIGAAYKAVTGRHRAKKIIREFAPDLVVGTGGYVSGPLMDAAASLGIRTAIHEQNAFPGVTTKLLAKKVDLVLMANSDAAKHLQIKGRSAEVGNPVRREIIFADREAARKRLAPEGKPLLLSYGGSLGAKVLNEAMVGVIAETAPKKEFYHIHGTGKEWFPIMHRLLKEQGVEEADCPLLDIREYINDMADCMAASDLLICRAGAITLSEITVMGKPSILIPSPNVTENHQYHNAMSLVRRGAAVIIEEKDLTPQRLTQEVCRLLEDPETLAELSKNARGMAFADSAERIVCEIRKLFEER